MCILNRSEIIKMPVDMFSPPICFWSGSLCSRCLVCPRTNNLFCTSKRTSLYVVGLLVFSLLHEPSHKTPCFARLGVPFCARSGFMNSCWFKCFTQSLCAALPSVTLGSAATACIGRAALTQPWPTLSSTTQLATVSSPYQII